MNATAREGVWGMRGVCEACGTCDVCVWGRPVPLDTGHWAPGTAPWAVID
jgi:hypothetical protein